MNFKKWVIKHGNGVKERVAKISIEVTVTRAMLVRFLCVRMAKYDTDEGNSYNSRKKVCDGVRAILESQGTDFADYWQDDCYEEKPEAIEAKAEAIIDKLFPELCL